MSKKVPKTVVLSYDLGGTKVAVGAVNSSGKVLREIRVPVAAKDGKRAFFRQLIDLGNTIIEEFPQIKKIGFASAGPLHPERGVLLDPTNLAPKHENWKNIPLTKTLEKAFKLPVILENDAAAAVLAEHWVGGARNIQNAMILTLGTGLGTGVIVNGKLVRAGRGLHTEAGHLILNSDDRSAICGCGNLGCAEAYLSGNGFAKRAALSPRMPQVTAVDVAEFARDKKSRHHREAKKCFDDYAIHMATALHNYAVIYAPEVVILTGSFANASDLFLEKTERELRKLLHRRRNGYDFLPQIKISELDNQAGLIGGAYVALFSELTPNR